MYPLAAHATAHNYIVILQEADCSEAGVVDPRYNSSEFAITLENVIYRLKNYLYVPTNKMLLFSIVCMALMATRSLGISNPIQVATSSFIGYRNSSNTQTVRDLGFMGNVGQLWSYLLNILTSSF